MSKKKPSDAEQLSLDLLLEQEPDKLHKLPIEPNDIGGELLAVLSKGLYTNPLDCIREYIQNSVDGRAQNVTIKITGNSVIIYDDGNGMNLDDLLQARQFGLSPKLYAEHVGFRGIGIYSGFDLCRRLRITSKKADDPHVHVLIFEFATMKNQLDAERGRSVEEGKTSLIDLLSEHTFIKRESAPFPPERHFTQVELQDIGDFHIRQLSNRTELRRYLLQNLPIDFSDTFEHKRVINGQLAQCVPGYHPLKIGIQSDGQPDDVVSKYEGLVVRDPVFGYLVNDAGQQIAYYWACLNSQRGHIDKAESLDGTKYEGFVYKAKGFSVGDRSKLRDMFARKPQLYTWYTGEFYVLDPAIVPNAERDNFETNQAKLALEIALTEEVKRRLLPDAEKFQAQGVARERIQKYSEELTQIETQLQGNSPSTGGETYAPDFKTYSRLDSILDDIKRQKGGASPEDRPQADEIIRRAERLQKQLRREAETPAPQVNQRSRPTGRKRGPEQPPDQLSIPIPFFQPKRLPALIEESGWSLEDDPMKLIALLQQSIEDVLGIHSAHYRNLMDVIESKMNSLSLEE